MEKKCLAMPHLLRYLLRFSIAANQCILSMRAIHRTPNRLGFVFLASNAVYLIQYFYLSVLRKYECKFLKQYQFVFVYSAFP